VDVPLKTTTGKMIAVGVVTQLHIHLEGEGSKIFTITTTIALMQYNVDVVEIG